MRVGDLITAINRQAVASVDDLHRFYVEWTIGQPVKLAVIRGKKLIDLTVVPVEAKSS